MAHAAPVLPQPPPRRHKGYFEVDRIDAEDCVLLFPMKARALFWGTVIHFFPDMTGAVLWVLLCTM